MGEHPGRPPGADDVAGDAQARRQPQPGEDRLPVHEPDPREDRRHVRLARRPSRAAGRSSSTRRSGSTSAGSRPSRRAPRRSATASGSRSSRTRSRPRSARPSSTSSTASASRTRAACSTSRSSTTSSRSPARSSPTASSGSARAATTRSSSWPRTRETADEIEGKMFAALGVERPSGPRPVPFTAVNGEAPRRGRGRGRSARRGRRRARAEGGLAHRAHPGPDGATVADAFERAVGALAPARAHRRRARGLARGALGPRRRRSPRRSTAWSTIGELDDERFAHRYAEDKRELSGWGSERIRARTGREGRRPAS